MIVLPGHILQRTLPNLRTMVNPVVARGIQEVLQRPERLNSFRVNQELVQAIELVVNQIRARGEHECQWHV